MIMELPKRFKLPFAEVINGQLVIYRLTRYEDMVYELTYALKKRTCVYCGKKLSVRNSTLDHRYPRDTGGVTITNNLFPCCPNCNSEKGNLTHQEYEKIKEMPKKDRKIYLKNLSRYKEQILRKKGFKLPKNWVTYEDVRKIKCSKPEVELRGKKYHRIAEFYDKYKRVPRPIIIDKRNNLLDGYNVLLFMNDLKKTTIPVIKLENVVLKT